MRNIKALADARSLFTGKDIDQEAKDQLSSLLISSFKNIKVEDSLYTLLPEYDLISLKIFHCFGLLPGFKDECDYVEGINVLLLWGQLLKSDVFFPTCVSFTTYDQWRFSNPTLLGELADRNGKFTIDIALARVMMFVMFCFDEFNVKNSNFQKTKVFIYRVALQLNVSTNECSGIGFRIHCMRSRAICIKNKTKQSSRDSSRVEISSINRQQVCAQEWVPEEVAKTLRGHASQKDYSPNRADFLEDCGTENVYEGVVALAAGSLDRGLFGLMNCLKAGLYLKEINNLNKSNYFKVAKLYELSSTRDPKCLTYAFQYFLMAGNLSKALSIAQEYEQRISNNEPLKEFWGDIVVRNNELFKLSQEKKKNDGAIAISDEDVDKLVEYIEGKPKQKKKRKKKSVNQQQFSKKVGDHNEYNTSETTLFTRKKDSDQAGKRPIKAVIKTTLTAKNIAYLDDESFKVKGSKGVIEGYQRLLSQHRNSRVKNILSAIDNARLKGDVELEYKIYKDTLNNNNYKICVGVERIWEEYAWTELHQFQECFDQRYVPEHLTSKVDDWIRKVRTGFILPSLGHILGMDQINENITPDAVKERVDSLLKRPELAKKSINDEIRFRLRCIYSTMAHSFSLAGLLNPRQSDHLMNIARKWYCMKSIDPNYERRKRK